jgi:hypothetical protein
MAAKLTRLTHKLAIELHLVVESCTICSFRCRRSVRKLTDTPSYFHWYKSQYSSVNIATDYGLDDRMIRVRIPAGGLGILLFDTVSRSALGPTQPPIRWVPGALSLGVKRLGREADHSPPSNAEVEECVELYHHSLIRAQLSIGSTSPLHLYILPAVISEPTNSSTNRLNLPVPYLVISFLCF